MKLINAQKELKRPKGDCMRVACENILTNKDWLFCYAYVNGRGNLEGQKIIHAWNEFQDVVFDYSNGNNVITRKERYYELAGIEDKDLTRQSYEEVMKLMFETKTYGGWIK